MLNLTEANPLFVRDTRRFLNMSLLEHLSLICCVAGIGMPLVFMVQIYENNGYSSAGLNNFTINALIFCLTVIIPLCNMASMRRERSHGNLELLNLTGITPLRLVCGKFAASMTFLLMTLMLILPCIAFLQFFNCDSLTPALWKILSSMCAGVLCSCIVLFVSQIGSLILQGLINCAVCITVFVFCLKNDGEWQEFLAYFAVTALMVPSTLSSIMDRVNPHSYNYAPYRRGLLWAGLLLCLIIIQYHLYAQPLQMKTAVSPFIAIGAKLLFYAYMFFALLDLERPHPAREKQKPAKRLIYHIAQSSGQAHMLLLGGIVLLNVLVLNAKEPDPSSYFLYGIPYWLVATNINLSLSFAFMCVLNLVNIFFGNKVSSWSRILISVMLCLVFFMFSSLAKPDYNEVLMPVKLMTGLFLGWLLLYVLNYIKTNRSLKVL